MRIKLTEAEFDEIMEARLWSKKNGGDGFGGFYDDLLEFHYQRRSLPPTRLPKEDPVDEDRPRRDRR